MRINTTTRVLHLMMILTVAFQLFSGLFMEVPEPGKIIGWSYIMFSWHIIFFGWLAFCLVLYTPRFVLMNRDSGNA